MTYNPSGNAFANLPASSYGMGTPNVPGGTSPVGSPGWQGFLNQDGTWGGIGSGVGSLLGGIFGNWQNPYSAAAPYLNNIPGTITPYYRPYIQAGTGALSQLQGQYGNLLNNPSAALKNFGAGFQADPGYQWQVDQMTKAANQAAAAGGMVGSPAEQQALAQNIGGLANQQYQNYLRNVMGIYGQGLGGLQSLNQMGYGASTGLAGNLANIAESQANMAAAQAQAQNQQQGGLWGGIGGLIGSLL